jgi:hypothetical protein
MKNNLVESNPIELEARHKLAALGEYLSQFEQSEFKVKHTFTDGIYAREIFLPKGSLVLGKIHRHNHLNFISQGSVTVFTKDGLVTYAAPVTMVSTAGTQRAVYANEDCVWTTIHHNPNNEQDLEKLEGLIIAPSYEALAAEKMKELI